MGASMIDVVEEFGLNAGRVWNALNECGPLTEAQLMEETCLRQHELSAAIGWLARENKIRKEGEHYSLGETNLTIKIGENAGKVWDLLQTWNEVNSTHIADLIEVEPCETHSALGWLAREGKIDLNRARTSK